MAIAGGARVRLRSLRPRGRMAELVDALDLGSSPERVRVRLSVCPHRSSRRCTGDPSTSETRHLSQVPTAVGCLTLGRPARVVLRGVRLRLPAHLAVRRIQGGGFATSPRIRITGTSRRRCARRAAGLRKMLRLWRRVRGSTCSAASRRRSERRQRHGREAAQEGQPERRMAVNLRTAPGFAMCPAPRRSRIDTGGPGLLRPWASMKVQVEELSPIERSSPSRSSTARVAEELDRAYATLGTPGEDAGFRPGKVPRRILEQRFKEQVEDDVIQRVVRARLPRGHSRAQGGGRRRPPGHQRPASSPAPRSPSRPGSR